MTIEYTEFVKTTEALLFSSDFKELEAKLESREPNLWQILDISHKEVLISRFLAWALNPKEQHSFKAQFLKRLVIETLRADENKRTNLSPVEIDVMDLSEAEVERENRLKRRSRCDIVIHCQKNGFLCVIENKVGAKESDEQTKHYYEDSFSAYPEDKYPRRVYIFLSPYLVPAKCENFISLSYQEILTAIEGLLSEYHVTELERFLLVQFQESVKRSIAMDKNTRELVNAIYEVHGSVIKFIYDNANELKSGSPTSDKTWDQKSWFFNIGDVGETPYSWDDSKCYSFICAGGGQRYRRIMEGLKVEDVIYAYSSGSGYVGIGTVTKKAQPFRVATLNDEQTRLLDLYQSNQLLGNYNATQDEDKCDWIVLVQWDVVVDKRQAVRLEPIVPSTASKVYAHRKTLIEKVKQGLGLKE